MIKTLKFRIFEKYIVGNMVSQLRMMVITLLFHESQGDGQLKCQTRTKHKVIRILLFPMMIVLTMHTLAPCIPGIYGTPQSISLLVSVGKKLHSLAVKAPYHEYYLIKLDTVQYLYNTMNWTPYKTSFSIYIFKMMISFQVCKKRGEAQKYSNLRY